jgi:nucleotide-binding universal stress UspA family protein
MQIDRILVAIDFSPHSDRALEYAIGLAKRLGAKLDLIHAYHVALPIGPPNQVAVPPQFWSDVRNAAERRLQEELQKVKAAGLEAEAHLTPMPPTPAIVDTAEEIGADLIVMGTRGHTGLKHVLLGSVAERTLRMAHCAVLTIRDGEEA